MVLHKADFYERELGAFSGSKVFRAHQKTPFTSRVIIICPNCFNFYSCILKNQCKEEIKYLYLLVE